MNILYFVTPLSIYFDLSTQKTFLVENFTLDEFAPLNMKIVAVTILGDTERLIMVRSYHLVHIVEIL